MNTRYALFDMLTKAAIEIETFDPSTGSSYGFTSSSMSLGPSTEICHDGTLIISEYTQYGFVMEMRFRALRIGSVWVEYDISEEELFQLSTVEDIGTITFDDIQYAHMKYMILCRKAKTKAVLSRDIYNSKLNGSPRSVLEIYQREAILSTMMNKTSMDKLVRELNGLTEPTQITKNGGI